MGNVPLACILMSSYNDTEDVATQIGVGLASIHLLDDTSLTVMMSVIQNQDAWRQWCLSLAQR